jgi:proteasome lid subunit RPN8/RPN11
LPHENGRTKEQPALRRFRRPAHPVLRFTPYAWAKLLFFRDAGDTEIGGFGITRITGEDLLLVEDFVTVKQVDTAVTVSFDDAAVADFYEEQVDLGRRPEQFSRIWIHTHPGASPSPSSVDEETFARVFGSCDWAVMHILAKGGETYTRLRFNVGPGGEGVLKTEVDFSCDFAGSDVEAWIEEYEANIFAPPPALDFGMDSRPRETRDFFSREPAVRRSVDEEDLREVLLDEYVEYWGVGREDLI